MSAVDKSALITNLTFPESPRWWDGCLWFVDGNTVKYIGSEGAALVHTQIDCPLLIGLTRMPDGGYLVGDSFGRKVWAVDPTGRADLFVDLSNETAFMINEIMLLADGSLVVDDIGFDALGGATPQSARLIRVAADGTVTRTGSPMLFANGMVASCGGTELFVAETFGARIWHYRLSGGGGLDEGRILAQGCTGIDGLAAAPDGTFWYANHLDGSVVQIGADGQNRSRLATGFNHATSCVLNDDGKKLYVTCAKSMPAPGTDLTDNGSILCFTFT